MKDVAVEEQIDFRTPFPAEHVGALQHHARRLQPAGRQHDQIPTSPPNSLFQPSPGMCCYTSCPHQWLDDWHVEKSSGLCMSFERGCRVRRETGAPAG